MTAELEEQKKREEEEQKKDPVFRLSQFYENNIELKVSFIYTKATLIIFKN